MEGMIRERLRLLREKMKEAGAGICLIPSSDCHESEYVCAHYRAREYMTGFRGSAGTAVVTLQEAGLWTDGRYFLQAEQELKGSGIRLFRQGEPGVPAVEEYIGAHLNRGELLAFDGSVVNALQAEKLRALASLAGGGVLESRDLVGEIWKDRPGIPDARPFLLQEQWTGEDTGSKLKRIREKMRRAGAQIHLLSSLCDIAWILNIRGEDIPGVPVLLSYLLVTEEECVWYVRPTALTEEVKEYLKRYGIRTGSYEGIFQDLGRLEPGRTVLVDCSQVNALLLSSLPKENPVLDRANPSELMKAVKNERELENLRKAHIKESLAFTRFIRWVKTQAGTERITELSAGEYLDERRKEQGNYLCQSFAPICAYGANAAVVHYSAGEKTNTELRPEGFLLVDAGGHYLEGTTDTTRTIALGPLSMEQKRMFTAVCRGNLNLANARFLRGCTGASLDILCREPLWQLGMDYRHGTGHGVGYLLNVHEGPNAFRWKLRKNDPMAECTRRP